jgi:hypothetical protein
MDPVTAVRESSNILSAVLGWVRGWRRRPKFDVTARVGTHPFTLRDGTGRILSERSASFVWLDVRNQATSAHSDAHGVLAHLWIVDDAGRELLTLRARWRKSPLPTSAPGGAINDRITIGSGLTEQLDALWKFPEETTAYALNSESIEREPATWQDQRYALPPGHYSVKVKVEGTNGPATVATFRCINPGVGPLTVDPKPTASVELDDLAAAADLLMKLSAAVPTPLDGMDADVLMFAVIGARARSLYSNFLHATTSPTTVGAAVAITPLIELAILAKWLSIEPELHRILWFGESDANDLRQIASITAQVTLRGSELPQYQPSEIQAKELARDEARLRLAAANRDYGDRLIPTLSQMVEEVETALPGFKIAMRDAYDLAYMAFSPWQDTAASTFKRTAEATATGGWRFKGDGTPYHDEDVKAIGAAMFAFLLETVLLGTQSGQPGVVRAVRDFVVLHWVRSDRLQTAERASTAPR